MFELEYNFSLLGEGKKILSEDVSLFFYFFFLKGKVGTWFLKTQNAMNLTHVIKTKSQTPTECAEHKGNVNLAEFIENFQVCFTKRY